MRYRKSNLPCILPTRTRNLRKMNPGCAAEQAAWRELKDGWRPLYGDVDKIGVAIEWHDFRIERSFNWGRTFHPNSLEFCLNLNGHGAVGGAGGTRSDYLPGNCGYYAVADGPLPASRRAHDHHQFVTLEFSREHLRNQLAQNEADLEPEIRRILFGKKEENVVAPARPMTLQQRSVVASLTEPPVAKAAQVLWYQGQGLGAHGAVFLCAEGSRIFLHASEAPGARASGPGEGDSHARSGEPADAGNAGARGGLQPVLSKQNFLARSRSHNPAILAKCSHGTGGRVVAHRPLQRHRSRDRSWLFEPESFQQSILRNHRLLPGAVSCGQERSPRPLTRSREVISSVHSRESDVTI